MVQSCLLLSEPVLVLKALLIISLFRFLTKVVNWKIKEVMPMINNTIEYMYKSLVETLMAFSTSIVAGIALLP